MTKSHSVSIITYTSILYMKTRYGEHNVLYKEQQQRIQLLPSGRYRISESADYKIGQDKQDHQASRVVTLKVLGNGYPSITDMPELSMSQAS